MVGVSISPHFVEMNSRNRQEHFSRKYGILVYGWLKFVVCIWNPRENLGDHLLEILKILKKCRAEKY